MNGPRVKFSSLEQKTFNTSAKLGESISRFNRRITLTALLAGTAINVLSDNSGTNNAPFPSGTAADAVDVPTGYQVVIEDVKFDVTGATAWSGGTGTYVQLEDTAGTQIVRFNSAQLTGNVHLNAYSASVSLGANFKNLGGVCTVSKGLQIKADANYGAGSDLLVTVVGYIEKLS